MIKYSGGTLVNTIFTQTTGTKAELVDWINGRLVAAGWTSTTNATHDFTLDSVVNGEGLGGSVRTYDPGGSNNCARLKFTNVAGTITQVGDCFLLPSVGKIWQFVGSRYQFYVFTPGSSNAREFVAGGTLYSLGVGVSEAVWGGGNANSDTDTASRASLRTSLGWTSTTSVAPGNVAQIVNGALTEAAASTTSLKGVPVLIGTTFSNTSVRWFNGGLLVGDPLFALSTNISNDPKVVGQLYDSFLINGTWPADVQLFYDGHIFQSITNYSGTTFSTTNTSLFVAIS